MEHPLELHADAGFEALPIDLNRNGLTDLFVACHRNDVGHVVDSQIFWNGPEGFSNDRTTPLPGMGPHRLNARLPGNAYTRAPIERYTSPPHDTGSRRPIRIGWQAEVPDTTALQAKRRQRCVRAELWSAVKLHRVECQGSICGRRHHRTPKRELLPNQ